MQKKLLRTARVLVALTGILLLAPAGPAGSSAELALPPVPPLHLSGSATRRKPEDIRLVWPEMLPVTPAKVKVYRVSHPRLTTSWETRALAALQVAQEGTSVLKVACAGRAGDWRLTMYSSGAMHLKRAGRSQSAGKDYPDPRRSQEIARTFLKKRGLWEDNATFSRVVDNTKGAYVMSVGFKCHVDGIPVRGPGARIIVGIGAGGHVRTVYKSWPVIQKGTEYPILSPKEAVDNFEKGQGYFPWESQGKVTSLELAYWAPPRMGTEYLLPAYIVTFRLPRGKEDLVGYLPAVKKEYIKKDKDKISTTKPSTSPAR